MSNNNDMPSYGPRPTNFGQQQPQQPGQPHKAPKPGKPTPRWAPYATGGVVGLLVGLMFAVPGFSDDTTTGASSVSARPATATTVYAPAPAPVTVTTTVPAPAATEVPETTEPPAVAAKPKPADFKLVVKALKKQCFGSAGCNVTFRIVVTYNGPALDPSTEYQVTYAVKGGEDPQSNTFTVTGTDYTYDEQEFIQTARASAKLTAVVTDVL